MLQVDALHCIAVTLLSVQLGVMILRTPKRLAVAAGALTAAIVVAAPVVWSLPIAQYLPLWAASYLNADNHSWFPLIPYSAFVLGGITYAYLFLRSKERRQTTRFMQRGVVAGMGAIALAVLTSNIPVSIYPPNDFWRVSPVVVTARFGFLLVAASALFFAEEIIHIPAKLPAVMGSESLFIYIVHLVIVYGSVLNNGLQHYYGERLSFWQAMGVFIIVFAAMSVLAYGWHTLKTKFKGWALFARIAIVWLLVFYFISRPY
jgi:Heparan-alpha-glucosaminide N-acetyltransferase, catalytic